MSTWAFAAFYRAQNFNSLLLKNVPYFYWTLVVMSSVCRQLKCHFICICQTLHVEFAFCRWYCLEYLSVLFFRGIYSGAIGIKNKHNGICYDIAMVILSVSEQNIPGFNPAIINTENYLPRLYPGLHYTLKGMCLIV